MAEPLEPGRQPRGAPPGGHHEIGVDELLRAAVGARQHPHAGDAPARRREPGDVAALTDLHAGQRPHAPPHVALDQRPAGQHGGLADRDPCERMARDGEVHLAHRVVEVRAVGRQLAGDAREELLKHLLAAREQRVDVAALRHRPAALAHRGQLVALDQRDAVVGLGERAGGEQPRHARADHHCVVVSAHGREHAAADCSPSRPEAAHSGP
jgi:hypothetical protein